MRKLLRGSLALSLISLGLITGCGSSDSSSSDLDSFNGLQSVPSLNGLVQSNSSSASARDGFVRMSANGVDLHAVSGTPPTLLELSASASLVDSAFFGGAVATIKAAGSASNTQHDQFWKGQGACWLGQSVAESLGRVLENGTSMCYMREIPKISGAVTVVSGDLPDPSKIFEQGDSDKLVKVAVSGQGGRGERDDEGGGNQDIFIQVFGKNSVGANVYKIKLYFCSSGGSVTGSEIIEINKDNGTYTATGSHGDENGRGSQSVSAFLKKEVDGTFDFDPSKDRSMSAAFSGSWGNFKGELVITGSNIMKAKRYNSFSFQGASGKDKNYSVAGFTGDSMKTLRFTDGASKGASEMGGRSHSYSTGTEYQNTAYVSVSDSSKLTEVQAFSFDSDAFFTQSLSVSTPTFSESCSATPDIAVSINMSGSVMQAVQTTCEGERFSNYGMCNSRDIQAVQQILFQQHH